MKKTFSDSYTAINAVDMGVTRKQYLKGAAKRFVILIAGAFPFVWGNRSPVVYTSREEAGMDCDPGDVIITEKEYLNRYCTAV